MTEKEINEIKELKMKQIQKAASFVAVVFDEDGNGIGATAFRMDTFKYCIAGAVLQRTVMSRLSEAED